MNLDPRMAGKWGELLKEISPRTVRVGIPIEPATSSYWEIYMPHFKVAAAALGMEVIPAMTHDMAEFEAFVAAQAREPNGGLIPLPGGFPLENRAEIIARAARHRLPAVYRTRTFAQMGGLLSYGNDNADNWRRTASYVDRILKGQNPSELPVQFPVKFELVINMKTAKALGLDVPVHLQQNTSGWFRLVVTLNPYPNAPCPTPTLMTWPTFHMLLLLVRRDN
jgi:putative ABC transport system substrate-binding protein